MKKYYHEDDVNPPKKVGEILIGGGKGKYQWVISQKGLVNLTPDQYQKYKHHSFDSYIKKSLKREARRGYREISRRLGFEVSLESLPEEAMDDLSFTDFYPCEYCSFFVADAVIIVENEALACALERLHPEERNLILMHQSSGKYKGRI